MTTLHLVPNYLRTAYLVQEWRNAAGVLATACPHEWSDTLAVLRSFRLLRSAIEAPGKNQSPVTQQIERAFQERGWVEKKFMTSVRLDDREYTYPTHFVDCFRGRVALEIEWNNQDTFFDRDLNTFRRLFDLRAIDVGVIITRSSELQKIFNHLGKGASYGPSTTHHAKLWPRLDGGSGGGCPVLTFAITPAFYVDDRAAEAAQDYSAAAGADELYL